MSKSHFRFQLKGEAAESTMGTWVYPKQRWAQFMSSSLAVCQDCVAQGPNLFGMSQMEAKPWAADTPAETALPHGILGNLYSPPSLPAVHPSASATMRAHWMGNPSVPKCKKFYKKPIFMQMPHFPGCLKVKLFYFFKKPNNSEVRSCWAGRKGNWVLSPGTVVQRVPGRSGALNPTVTTIF